MIKGPNMHYNHSKWIIEKIQDKEWMPLDKEIKTMIKLLLKKL